MARPKIALIGAGQIGGTLAHLVALKELGDVVLFDIAEGVPQGKALDLAESGPVEPFDAKLKGTNDYADTAGSDVVVITAGLPRKPGMSRMDLLGVNAGIVKSVTEEIVRYSPDAVIIVVTNPLDQMTTLAAEVSGFDRNRVLGQAGMLDSARFAHFIAEAADHDILDITAVTLGSHGETMVPVPSLCLVGDTPLIEALDAETVDELVDRTRKGGAEIVAYLKTGSAYYAPSAAAASMVRAIVEDSDAEMPVCAWMTGEYGIDDVYLGVIAKLGAGGVKEVVEVDLTPSEQAGLVEAATAVKEKVAELAELDD